MEKEKFIQLFNDETLLIFQKYNLGELNNLLEENISLLNEMDESFVKKIVKPFVNAIHKGEVTIEIMQHNLNELKNVLLSYKNNEIKQYLNVNVDPTLYLEKEELEITISSKFEEKLKKTMEIEKESTSMVDPSALTSLFGGKGFPSMPGFRQKPTSKKYKHKKKK